MSTAPVQRLTPQEYLRQEREATFKSEYFRGEMFAMAGASRVHNLIVANVIREAGNVLKGRPCEVYPSDLRVLIEATGLYTYPDVTVTCDQPKFEDAHHDSLTNPRLIVEVLSDSTEAYDRGKKWAHYRQIRSLREYVLISTNRFSVESYVRGDDGQWTFREMADPHGDATFESMGIAIPMAEIYRHIALVSTDSPGGDGLGFTRPLCDH